MRVKTKGPLDTVGNKLICSQIPSFFFFWFYFCNWAWLNVYIGSDWALNAPSSILYSTKQRIEIEICCRQTPEWKPWSRSQNKGSGLLRFILNPSWECRMQILGSKAIVGGSGKKKLCKKGERGKVSWITFSLPPLHQNCQWKVDNQYNSRCPF